MDIKWYKSTNNSDRPLNGGCISSHEASKTSFEYFDNLETKAVEHKKLFVKLVDEKCQLIKNTRIFIKNPGFLGDFVTLSYGNEIDTQNDLHPDREQYGVGMLVNNLKKDDFEIVVRISFHGDIIPRIFRSRDLIYISKINESSDNSGKFVRISQNHPVTWDGNLAKITTENPISMDFKIGRTTISSVLEPGDLQAEVYGINVKSKNDVRSSFAELFTVNLYNSTSVDQKWTLTFKNHLEYSCLGECFGGKSVGKTVDGNIMSVFEPIDKDTGNKFFRLSPFFGNNEKLYEGDQITFYTNSPSKSFWQTKYTGKHNVMGKREYQIGFSGQV